MLARNEEMIERRKRLMKLHFKKSNRLNDFESGYEGMLGRKKQIIATYDNTRLEELLKRITKNVAQELV